jgi:hypothetical protein
MHQVEDILTVSERRFLGVVPRRRGRCRRKRGAEEIPVPPEIEKKEKRQADADGTRPRPRRQRSNLDAHEAPQAGYARNSKKGGR